MFIRVHPRRLEELVPAVEHPVCVKVTLVPQIISPDTVKSAGSIPYNPIVSDIDTLPSSHHSTSLLEDCAHHHQPIIKQISVN